MKKTTFFFALFMAFATTLQAQWQKTEGILGEAILHATVDGATVYVTSNQSVYKSNNNGNSWTLIYDVPNYITTIAANGPNIYVGTDYFLFVSNDNGNTWTKNTQIDSSHVISVVSVGTKTFVATLENIYVSTNNGTTWASINNGLRFPLFSMAANGTTIVVNTSNGNFISVNSGNTWTPLNSSIPPVRSFTFIGTTLYALTVNSLYASNDFGINWRAFSQVQDAEIKSIAVSGTTIYAATTKGVLVTTINGSNAWTLKNNGLTDTYAYSIVAIEKTIIVGSNCSLYVSTNDGDSWVQSRIGMTNTPVRRLADAGSNMFATTYNCRETYISTNKGKNWTPTNDSRVGDWTKVIESDTKTFMCGTKGLFVSTNNGLNWRLISNGLPNWGVYNLTISGTNMYALTNFGTYLSTNNGDNWSLFSNDVPPLGLQSLVETNGSNIFVSVSSSANNGVFFSNNNGLSWQQVMNTNATINSLTVSGANVYVGTRNGLFLSSNNGNSWSEIGLGLPNSYITSVAVKGANLFVVLGNYTQFLSTNNGATWRPINDYFPTKAYIFQLSISGDYVFAATNRGVYRRPLSEFNSVGTKENSDALGYTISPNPVTNTLIINVSDALVGKKYSINNILGETIKSDVLTNQLTEFNVHNLANGIYFLHLIGTNKSVKFVKE